MLRWGSALAGCTLLLACAGGGMEEQPLTAAEMPVSFAYGELGPEDARYEQAVERARGWGIRRVKMRDGTEFAIFDLVSLSGDYGLLSRETKTLVGDMLVGRAATWGRPQQVGGARPTEVQPFTLDGNTGCVGLQRCLRAHLDARPGAGCQELVKGFYCRLGPPLEEAELREVALALHGQL